MDLRRSRGKKSLALVILFSILLVPLESTGKNQLTNITNIIERRNRKKHPMDFRIVGGMDASIKDFPYIVSVQINSDHNCGGSILNKLFILTAAHCVVDMNPGNSSWKIMDPLQFNIVAGQTILELGDNQMRDVKKIFVHSGYKVDTMKNDIAIMEITTPLEWTKHTRMAQIASANHSSYESHEFCTAVGWGSTSAMSKGDNSPVPGSKTLQQVDLPTSSRSACEKFFSYDSELFDESKICIIVSDEKDACAGDSGGPFVCNGVQYGITSFGLGCAQLDMPGVFTNIPTFNDWIYGVLNDAESEVVSKMAQVVNLSRIIPHEKTKDWNRMRANSCSMNHVDRIYLLFTVGIYSFCNFVITDKK